jgi:type II secretory pathway pseudopilin PulG
MRRSFTLIEIVVAFSVLAIAAGALIFGLNRSIRAVKTQCSKERLERLFLQAFRFSSISGHVSDVLISKEPEGWVASLTLWENTSKEVHKLAQKSKNMGQLGGIHSILINDCEVQSASFRFFGGHGLLTVCANDQFDKELSSVDLRFLRDAHSNIEPELIVSIHPTPDSTHVETISLKPYFMTTPSHPTFPSEYTQSS